MGTYKRWVMCTVLVFLLANCNAAKVETKPVPQEKPKIVHMGPVAPNLISITIQTGRVEYGEQIPYVRESGDSTSVDNTGNTWVLRRGKMIGALISGGTKIMTLDRVVGDKLNTDLIDRPDTFTISSPDDAGYLKGTQIANVFRKSKPTDLARVGANFDAPIEHTLYLKLPTPLKTGKKYTLTFKSGELPEQSFSYDPRSMKSEAVHVSHIGFRPDDPSKVAFLSLWMGSGGPMDYKDKKVFYVIDEKTGKSSFEGEVKLSKSAREKDEDAYYRNFNGVDVYIMDFSSLKEPGMYRVYVEGVGCSYPFEVGAGVWYKAFHTAARGFYHQRSGMEIGPPFTTYKRPRNFHPEDGMKVYASGLRLMDTENGLAPESGDHFSKLLVKKTSVVVPNAWGGYCDAGDWDRRINHLDVGRYLLELVDMFPPYFEKANLNIPKTYADLPDIINEALWGIDFFRRLQTADGGISGGIESEAHPRYGEASWQESLTVMAYAPDVWCSYLYAGVAAQAGYVLRKRNPGLSGQYLESALKAMSWAEKELKARPSTSYPHQVNDARNLAAAELFRFTGKKEWNDLFIQTSVYKTPDIPLYRFKSHDQSEGAWVYYNTDKLGMNATIKNNYKSALRTEADTRIRDQLKTGFRWSKNPWRPAVGGSFAVPDCLHVIRAYIITNKKEYLQSAVLASQTGAGANPLNMSYTTGVGYKYPQHVLHIDSRVTRQSPPPGLTVEGPVDVEHLGGSNSPLHMYAGQFCYPHVREWPSIENYWDVFWYPMMCEFTIHQSMVPTAYVWGYLAARK
ncbi:MAG: hypothetical protein C0392_04485 [Syntrophus sp. (in: bacteria)]|nr:hypothetical protein [Syntrophus sp. (in: bacteria)]